MYVIDLSDSQKKAIAWVRRRSERLMKEHLRYKPPAELARLKKGHVAQLVEPGTLNSQVGGSKPPVPTKEKVMNVRVWKWIHEYNDGIDVCLFPSEEQAVLCAYEYVRSQALDGSWEPPSPLSEVPEEDVEAYFEDNEETEWSSFDSEVIEFPTTEKESDDTVELTSEECTAVAIALELEGLPHVLIAAMGLKNYAVAAKIVNAAYKKIKD